MVAKQNLFALFKTCPLGDKLLKTCLLEVEFCKDNLNCKNRSSDWIHTL